MAELMPFGNFLEDNHCSLLASTYKSNLMLSLTSSNGQVETTAWRMPRPMGIDRLGRSLAVGTETVVVQYTDQPDLVQFMGVDKDTDALFLKRSLHITGDLNIHDVNLGNATAGQSELWFVNTRFSCLSTLAEGYSFIPRWKPEWISSLVGEDRCHLNGMALVEGKPKFVTSFSQSDKPQGWRDGEKDSGVVVDVDTNEVVARGLYHPHSPRWYRNNLYVLESGTGSLCRVNVETGEIKRINEMSGYVRGLSFVNNYAVVGISKIRASNSSNLDLESLEEHKAGIGVVELESGSIVATLRFDEEVAEIFDLEILDGIKKPAFAEHDTASSSMFVVPSGLKPAFGS
jgi:uncharacterized protein (TIGR03032 family)